MCKGPPEWGDRMKNEEGFIRFQLVGLIALFAEHEVGEIESEVAQMIQHVDAGEAGTNHDCIAV